MRYLCKIEFIVTKIMIEVKGITKSFEHLQVLKGIDLNVGAGEIVSIVGPSGAGKTTLLQIIGSLDRPDSGSVSYDGRNIFELNDKRLARFRNSSIGFIFQFHQLLPEFTLQENVAMPALIGGAGKSDAMKRAADLLNYLGLADRMTHRPAQLSGGERQRVAIARAVATEPKIMLFDEPLAALDFKRKSEIMPWLEKLKTNLKIPMLYVTHSAEEVLHLADNLIVMEDGRIKTSGALTDVLANIDLPIKIGEDTGVLLKGKIVSKDKEWSLMTVDCGNIALHIGDNGQPIGSPASLRILAREVVFAKEKPSGLSVQNAFEGVVEEISVQKDSSGALIRANCSGQIIVGKLTRKALSELDIKEGSQIWLLIKSVALLSV